MKIGVIPELLQLPLYESIKRAAELGAEGVQLYAVGRNCNLLEMGDRQLRELKEHCKGCGLMISAVCGDLGGHGFRNPLDNPRRIETSKRIIEIARKLGCGVVTMHVGVIPASRGNDEIYEAMLVSMRDLGSFASRDNAVVAIETGPEPAVVLKRFLEDAGVKGLGVNLDPANLLMVLNEDPVESVHMLKDYIVHTHAKDGKHYRKCDPVKVYDAFAEGGFERLVAETGELFAELPIGKGAVDWDAYLQALKESKYEGYLTIERESGDTPVDDVRMAIEFLRRKISRFNLKRGKNHEEV